MNDRKELIKAVLLSFKITTYGFEEIHGTTVTLYKFRPQIGVRISRIRGIKDELASVLRVSSVRIIAPMEDGSVGIEVPNKDRAILPLSDILSSQEYEHTSMSLPLCIGRKVDGSVFMADLAEMPHLLVAGATGQGKSVGLNVMLMSLLQKKTPDELKLLLIDPKKVELSIYSSIKPYLAAPVITDTDEAQIKLEAVCQLMDERYELLSSVGVRNIKDYNALAERGLPAFDKLPYLVVVIDEYGDLILQSGRDMERAICRIAQKARAVGIHMIVSTQRPAANIVTGNIKANFPTRIAFRTTTGTDSRVIIDQVGAEKLSGKGDMLFFSGADLTRVQCAYASNEEVLAACNDIKARYADYTNSFTLPKTATEIDIEKKRRIDEYWHNRLLRAMGVQEEKRNSNEETERNMREWMQERQQHAHEIEARREQLRQYFYGDTSRPLSLLIPPASRIFDAQPQAGTEKVEQIVSSLLHDADIRPKT